MAKPATSSLFFIFLAYLAFVVYGSLLPFEFRTLSFADALEKFQHIRFRDLGVVSRADWIANILLYIPLAYLGCSWGTRLRGLRDAQAFAIVLVITVCLTVAVTVEFTQQFFAPRTVSLNDLMAETIGTSLGVVLWVFGRERVSALWHAFQLGGRPSLLAAIALYTVLYLLLSLFPYDFVISLAEFKGKLASDNLGWFTAGDCSNPLRCLAVLTAEMAAIAPLGLLLALVSPSLSLRRLFVAGLLLGLVLELLQLPLVSGMSQGLSVLLRGAGLVSGAGLARLVQRVGVDRIVQRVWQLSVICAVPYLVAVAALNGWFAAGWVSPGEGVARLGEVNLLPFYYHYFTTETIAVRSLLAQLAMYMPVGIAVWAAYARLPYRGRGKFLSASIIAMFIALPVELGKAMAPGAHPDFTNVIIAPFGAVLACWLAQWLESVLRGGRQSQAGQPTAAQPPGAANSVEISQKLALHPIGVLSGVVAALGAVAGIVGYPVGAALIILVLAGYVLLLIRRPWSWLFALAALLPVLDLSQITGRLLLDEFDLLVLATLSIGYWRLYALPPRDWPNRLLLAAYALLWLTWAVSMARGLWPLNSIPDNVLASSHSPHEAWYTGKGMLWALLLVPLLRRIPVAQTEAAQRLLINGLVTGLALLCCVVLWERHVFVGIGDFRQVFRVTGSFSSMATGGAYIEAYIAFVFPVLAVWVMRQQSLWGRLAGIALAAVATYAMMVTFSRGGYAGLAAGFTVVGLAVWRGHMVTVPHRALVMAGVVVAAVVVAIPVLTGEFAQSRLSQTTEDFQTRLGLWSRALKLMDSGVVPTLAGMGFGRYPTQYLFYAGADRHPGNYYVLRENDATFVRLGVGEPVYLDQVVALEPGSVYQLSVNIRQAYGESELKASICEKSLLTSFDCQGHKFVPDTDVPDANWHTLTIPVASNSLGGGGNWPHRPVRLSLYNLGSQNPIDVAEVSLKSVEGSELLANGNFSAGIKRWLFVSDQDPAWHIHQQEIEMYFAQGWLGLLAFFILLLALVRSLWPAIRTGDNYAIAITGALVAFLTVGLLGSTMDTARLSMLFYFGALSGGLLSKPEGRHFQRKHQVITVLH